MTSDGSFLLRLCSELPKNLRSFLLILVTPPFFYIAEYDASQKQIVLDEDTSKHIVQVLRMKKGERLNLTDGKGNLLTAEITDDHKKHCEVSITDSRFTPHDSRKITIAISLLKNSSRFEWFLEKATEIGIHEIIPLICKRTEKQKFREDRMQNIIDQCDATVTTMLVACFA